MRRPRTLNLGAHPSPQRGSGNHTVEFLLCELIEGETCEPATVGSPRRTIKAKCAPRPAQHIWFGSSAEEWPSCELQFSIIDNVASWCPESGWDQAKKKHAWPFQDQGLPVDLAFFETFLKRKNKKPCTIEARLRGAKYFFTMFNCDGVDTMPPIEKLFRQMYETDVLDTIMSLPVLSPEYSWTDVVVRGLWELVSCLKTRCLKRHDIDGHRDLELVLSDVLVGRKSASTRGKQARAVNRTMVDKKTYDDMFDVKGLKAAVKQSMVDLAACSWAMKNKYLPKGNWIGCATVMMHGIIFVGGQRGRPGEWALVQKEDIRMSYSVSTQLQ